MPMRNVADGLARKTVPFRESEQILNRPFNPHSARSCYLAWLCNPRLWLDLFKSLFPRRTASADRSVRPRRYESDQLWATHFRLGGSRKPHFAGIFKVTPCTRLER